MKHLTLIILIICLWAVTAHATFSLLRNDDLYQCLSTDTKLTTGILLGSRLFETDTGRTYTFDGTSWVLGGFSESSVNSNYPIAVDGDSVYEKDISTTYSDIGTFSGDINSLVNDYRNEITDITATNPKTFTIHLNRPITSNKIGIGSLTGDFSNVKIILKDEAGVVRQTVDDSANNTDYTSKVYSFTLMAFIEIVVEFHTADAVKINGMFIPKSQSRNISGIDGYVSENNSTFTPLNAGITFTGTSVDTLNYGMIVVSIKSDQDSATDGLSVQFSPDGTNWDHTDVYTVEGGTGKTFSFQTAARYLRVVYTNGSVNQTYFRLQTVLKPVYVKPSSHRIADAISGQDDAELIKAVSTGLAPDGTFKNVLVTNAGNQKISIEEFDPAVSTVNADRTTNLDGETGLNVNAMVFGRVSDTVVKNARLDASTESQISISYEHHELHDGTHYMIDDVAELAINNVYDMQWTTPDTTNKTHFTFALSVEAETEWYLYENCVITVAGTTITPFNNNRDSGNTSGNTIAYHLNTTLANANADTDVSGATLLMHGKVGAGRSAGDDQRDREIIFKQNEDYCMRAIATAAGYVNFSVNWYEHTARN